VNPPCSVKTEIKEEFGLKKKDKSKSKEYSQVQHKEKPKATKEKGNAPRIKVNLLTLKHPLGRAWTFWYFDPTKKEVDWNKKQIKLSDVDTVEDFWAVFNFIDPVTDLKNKADYSLFRKGVRPCWDDPINKDGGRYVLNYNQRDRVLMETHWKDLLCFVIGEPTEPSIHDKITGAVVSVRDKVKQGRLSLWLSGADPDHSVIESVDLTNPNQWQFSLHQKEAWK